MVLLWPVLLCLTATALPIGLQGGIGVKTINDFIVEAVPAILQQVKSSEFPPITQKFGKLYFTVTLQVRDLVLTELSIDSKESKVSFEGPDLIHIELKQFTGAASFKWLYDSSLGGGAGGGQVSFMEPYATLILRLGEKDGKLKVTVEGALISISEINMQLNGTPIGESLTWLVSAFKDEILGALAKNLSASLGSSAQAFFDAILAEPSTIIPFGEGSPLGIDYYLPKAPLVTEDYLELYSHAVIVQITNPVTQPPIGLPVPLPAFNSTGGQIQLSVSEYTVNSGLYATVNAGLANFTITNAMLGVDSLNTNSLNVLLPDLKKKYGNDQECELRCSVLPYPSVKFIAKFVNGTATFDCEIYVIEAQEAPVKVNLTTNFNVTFRIEDWKVVGKINEIEVEEVKKVASLVNIDVGSLKYFLNLALKGALPTISESIFGNSGIPLPSLKGIDLEDLILETYVGYMFIQATPKYDYSS